MNYVRVLGRVLLGSGLNTQLNKQSGSAEVDMTALLTK